MLNMVMILGCVKVENDLLNTQSFNKGDLILWDNRIVRHILMAENMPELITYNYTKGDFGRENLELIKKNSQSVISNLLTI